MGDREAPPSRPRGGNKASERDAAKARRRGRVQMAGVGLELAAGIVGGIWVGSAVDDWLGTDPWFMMIFVFGALFGAVARLVILSSRLSKLRAGSDKDLPDA